MKRHVLAALGAALLVSSVSFAVTRPRRRVLCDGFLPKNDLKIPVGDIHAAGISEAVFNHVLDNIEKVYGPIVAQHGGHLVVNRLWDDPTVNASAEEQGGDWIINMYGGLARHAALTEEGMYLVACHELGHHLGGFPKMGGWATNEGGADYYATLKCLRRMLPTTEIPGGGDPVATSSCNGQFQDKDSRNRCQRSAMAGESLGSLLAQLSGSATPSLSTPDASKVDQTNDDHPEAQCRLDTYFQGGLCQRGVGEELANDNPNDGACTRKAGFQVGLRPRCWYKPPADEPEASAEIASRHIGSQMDGLRQRIRSMGAVLSSRGV